MEYSGAFQVPAQAKPLGAISRIPALLVAKVNVGEIAVPELFCALAVSSKVAPTCMEKVVLGFRVIFPGKGEVPAGLR